MARRRSNNLGDLIVFEALEHPEGWIDEFDNKIPAGSLGMIVSKQYKRFPDYRGWEYDILIPSLGIVSPNWGNFAFNDLKSDL